MKKLLALVFALLTLTAHGQGNDERGYIVKVGDMAPDFTIEYLDGTARKLSEMRGRVVMIQFTASWCSVCRAEMPHIESDIWLRHKGNPGFALIGIDYKETRKVTKDFAEKIQVTYPLTLDEKGDKFHLYAGKGAGVTRNVIIGKDGRIAYLTRLFNQEEFAAMKQAIEKLLTE